MQIANPIYDVVFKYLMQNNEIAILILSTILEEEILSLDLLPQETAVTLESRSFTVYHLDFSARIRTATGEEKHVVIEIQKAKFATDIMRFRRYLGDQYTKGFPVEGEKSPKPIPIISIYFLGYKLDHAISPVIKVYRTYRDGATGETLPEREEHVELLGERDETQGARNAATETYQVDRQGSEYRATQRFARAANKSTCSEEFIESLTHDSIIIQIPFLGPERRNATERLLAIFDQHRKVERDGHLLDVDEENYPEEYRKVVRLLNGAVSEPEIRKTMEVEDEILAELEDKERLIAGKDKLLEENAKALEENAKVIEEKDKALEEKAKALEGKERELAEKNRLIAELRGGLNVSGVP
uniref:PD-(D/E)XK nuclease family transposase n=1 Tax=Candidatus Kentrum sp. DK TaxID=2126562 RepID=A0A450ST51_9GAMM|nr:MAG: hypothetical protein BECKDK2373B_GA0170837_106414 [Candidatus Kentron sp. DK]